MKFTACTLGVLLTWGILQFNPAFGQTYPTARLTVRVLDEAGRPVENANATIVYHVAETGRMDRKDVAFSGGTNTRGEFSAESVSDGDADYNTRKEGYYWSKGKRCDYERNVNGRWEPWNPTVALALKKIINPVPMYGKNVDLLLPKNVNVGYDLMVGDFVAPHGKGAVSDFVFFKKWDVRSDTDYDKSLTVTFSNPGDGIQEFEAPYGYGSAFISPREAPEDGYLNKWEQTVSSKPGTPRVISRKEERNYFFRVRTVMGGSGKVVKALYGKIYGDFTSFTYYLNPDGTRNMECDVKKNLLTGLKSFERPGSP